jgi:hypothetical protein
MRELAIKRIREVLLDDLSSCDYYNISPYDLDTLPDLKLLNLYAAMFGQSVTI